MIKIDGSFGEGGGQILRTALTLAAITGEAVQLFNIRANRKKPGLAPQHLTNVRGLAEICQAKVEGAQLRSTEITFVPTTATRPGTYTFDVATVALSGSAGSVTLILQTLLLPLAFTAGESKVTLTGGTHVPWSPAFDYIENVYLPVVRRSGIFVTAKLNQWGFYPVGHGRIEAAIRGNAYTELKPVALPERGDLTEIRGRAVACNLPAHIAQRMTDRASRILRDAGLKANIQPVLVKAKSTGAGLFLTANYENISAGFSALGKIGKASEKVAEEACEELLAHHQTGAPVDPHLADQLLLPLAFAKGESKFKVSKITRHLLTNAFVIKHFLPAEIVIEGNEGDVGIVSVANKKPDRDLNPCRDC